MKKVFSILTVFVLGMFVFSSCSSDEDPIVPEPPVPAPATLAGNEWTFQEGDVTTVFKFLDETNLRVTETSVSAPASLKITRAETTKTYDGTYTYDSEAKSAELSYNNRVRKVENIQFGEGSVSFKIDGKEVTTTEAIIPTPTPVYTDKEFLEQTGKEFVGLFSAAQAAPYTSIINVIKESSTEDIDDDIDNIIDGLTSHTGTNPEVYKYAIKAAAFNGIYRLIGNRWKKESGNGLYAEFNDNQGRQCKLTVTTSGNTKNVIVYDEEYDEWNYNLGTIVYKERIYEVELPSHIECLLTQGGSQLVKVVVNLDLSKLTAGQKINLSRNSLSFDCTADFRDVAKVTTTANYQAQGASTVNIIVEKNGKTILTANATSQSNLSGAPYDLDDDDLKNVTNTHLDLNVLDKVQIKGVCSNIGSMVDALEKADDYETRYDEQAVRQYVSQANTFLTQADVYYNKDNHTRRAYLKFDVDYRESYYWDNNTSTSYPRNKYIPTSSICFPDGSSYFVEKYFSEDAFKSLVDMFNDLTDKVEGQIN